MTANDNDTPFDPEQDSCPECGGSFIDGPIPETHREHFGGSTHYRSLIAVYDRERDCTVAWKCPHCKHQWPRDARVVEQARDHGRDG